MSLTPDEARAIARSAAKEAVRETLELIGVDVNDPREAQRDMQFIRSWRLSSEAVKRQGLIVGVTVFISGALGLFWMFIRN